MKLLKVIQDYFEYYPSERKGLFIISVILFIWVLALFIYSRVPIKTTTDQTFIESIEAFHAALALKKIEEDSLKNEVFSTLTLFAFNPNTISRDSLMLLGLPARTASAIINYREKGGFFKSVDDLSKIYNLSDSDFVRIAPFVSIDYKSNSSDTSVDKSQNSTFEKKGHIKKEEFVVQKVEINSADTIALDKVYGIGPYLARKIVERREALGGYLTIIQLLEIYSINNEVLDRIEPYLSVDTTLIQKINLNTVALDRLKKHPYIKYSLANSLINIRKQHGPYRGVKDLYRSDLMTDSIYTRIRPYIKFND